MTAKTIIKPTKILIKGKIMTQLSLFGFIENDLDFSGELTAGSRFMYQDIKHEIIWINTYQDSVKIKSLHPEGQEGIISVKRFENLTKRSLKKGISPEV